MQASFFEFLKERDVFGQPITVSYKGSDVLKTYMGTFATILTYALILFNGLTLFTNFANSELAQTSSSTVQFDRHPAGAFNFEDNSFRVSVTSEPHMPENIGRVGLYLEEESCIRHKFTAL